MSVLLVGPDDVNGPAVVRLLVSEGDEVGVIEPRPAAGDGWKVLGAHVARGSLDDSDLIERAAQHARSIVLFDATEEGIAAAVEGARLVGASPARIIYLATAEAGVAGPLRSSGLEFVLLLARPRRRVFRRGSDAALTPESVAAAVSAADDLAGDLRLEIDLNDAGDREQLGL